MKYRHLEKFTLPETRMKMNPNLTKQSALRREPFAQTGSVKNDAILFITEKGKNRLFTSFTTNTFTAARNALTELIYFNIELPHLIVIDVPFAKIKIREFNSWLKSNPSLKNIPIVYERQWLDAEETEFLTINELVDDVVEPGLSPFMLLNKADFLKMHKESKLQTHESTENFAEKGKNVFDFLLRRTLNIIGALALLIALLPVLLIIALLIKLESKGPVFYYSKRAGKGYKVFNFIKFRTMVQDADTKVVDLMCYNQYNNNGAQFFKLKNDPRVTRIGNFLRNTSLDELPQLINVLKGEMALVGNRPLPLYEAKLLTTNEWVKRFEAPAGITGLWQISKRGNEEMSAEERIDLDISYADDNNFLRDLYIMIKTPSALFQKANV